MRKHCITVHQGEAQPLSYEDQHRQEIQVSNTETYFTQA